MLHCYFASLLSIYSSVCLVFKWSAYPPSPNLSPPLQCLPPQWALIPFERLWGAGLRFSLQHRHGALPALHRPRQPVFPPPQSHASLGVGAKWHRAFSPRGRVENASNQCNRFISFFLCVCFGEESKWKNCCETQASLSCTITNGCSVHLNKTLRG